MSEVQQRVVQEREKEAERGPQQWREVVEDIWQPDHLPHFRGAVYTGDGDFLFDAAQGRYLFQNEVPSEGEDDLMAGGDEEEEEDGEREGEQDRRENGGEVEPPQGMLI